jgi:hypothetical protein
MTPQASAATPIKATLIDITKCIGCRACQVACKQWNEREGEHTELDFNLGFQNPATLSAKTLTLITYHEIPNEAPAEFQSTGGLTLFCSRNRQQLIPLRPAQSPRTLRHPSCFAAGSACVREDGWRPAILWASYRVVGPNGLEPSTSSVSTWA